ncbi:DUF6319 family protein [Mycobacterium sp. ITM-2016-00317]|uniref:DUF6319 family protein n=1 Tax=Mycobacterium sp. ITM-2016-00317 TaxID=2099694 RepID=UPI000D42E407|nr:DUF6319 family protein [Mycobacterium sp. ITM-2016-00317]WNG90357.1 DUF6319 family protein [Mycobacterium sp. ITM-2016-00317]
MSVDTLPTEAPIDAAVETVDATVETVDATVEEKPRKTPAKRGPGRKTKSLELTITVTGSADGDWRAELKQGSTFLVRDVAVAAAAVSRAARELHEDLSTPIDAIIEEARSQQAARVLALEAELEAARRALADLD